MKQWIVSMLIVGLILSFVSAVAYFGKHHPVYVIIGVSAILVSLIKSTIFDDEGN